MIAHLIPFWHAVPGAPAQPQRLAGPWFAPEPDREGRDGPVCVPLHASSRCEGACFGPGGISRSFGPRWLRWTLLLSGPRPAGSRCWRQCFAGRDTNAHRRLSALFRTAGAVRAVALWQERGTRVAAAKPLGARE